MLKRLLQRKEQDILKNGHKIDHRQEFDTNSTDTSKFSSLKSKDPLQKDGTETLIQQRKNTKKEDGEMLEQKTDSNDNKQKEKTSLVSSIFHAKDISPLLKLAKAKLAAYPDISMLVIRPPEKLSSGGLKLKNNNNESEKILYEDIFPKKVFPATITKIVKKEIHKEKKSFHEESNDFIKDDTHSKKVFSTISERILQSGCFQGILDETNFAEQNQHRNKEL